jgi:hypothetical protein
MYDATVAGDAWFSHRALRTPALAGACALVLAACATASSEGTPVRMTELPEPAPASGPFVPLGELLFSGGRSAGYSTNQIAGPTVNLAYAGQGRWAGSLDGRSVQFKAETGKISGPNVNIHVFQDGNQITVRGTWFQRDVWLTVSDKALRGRTDSSGPSYDFTRESPGMWAGTGVRGREGLEARGQAQQVPAVLMPHFALALLAALP